MAKEEADIGLIGMAVMGENLALNMNDQGWKVAVYNRTVSKVDAFLETGAKGTPIIGTHTLEEFISTLKRPRKMILMVKAGEVIDQWIEKIAPHLDQGDIIIDGGNSYFEDTNRRVQSLKEKGIFFIGAGVSGGEEGARHGPSIMPGGAPEAWPEVKPILQSIAAKAKDGLPCCDWVGDEGAGHYVKMVHNGIEYGDMQLICEAYHFMNKGLGLDATQLSHVFKKWNEGELDSYLIEITSQIFAYKDENGSPLVDNILDVAGQKGTGKWTAINALHSGIPVTLIAEAVFARCLSSLKSERIVASKILKGPSSNISGNADELIKHLGKALYLAKIISYTQGFMLMKQAAKDYGWNLNIGSIAMLWREGCIIRSAFLEKIKEAFENNPSLDNLLLDPFFHKVVEEGQQSLREVVATAVRAGIPTPTLSSAIAFLDGIRSERLPQNLLQAQRDFFGAHQYERVDAERGKFFHTNWTGTGGVVSSTAYNA